MIWIAVAVAIAFLAFFFFRPKPRTVAKMAFADQKNRASLLPHDKKKSLAAECRQTAHEGYDAGKDMAIAAGKDDSFAHQVGILEAAQRVLANELRNDTSVTRGLQMETVPFNNVESALGREAIAEYLVWKFFPEFADTAPIEFVTRKFVDEVYRDDAPEDDIAYDAIYSNKYDWQTFAVAAAKARFGEKNG